MRRTKLVTIRAGARGGQALLVAVLLMMAILLVGILFVALVTYNQAQSARHEDTRTAQEMAETGVRYAAHMMETSPEGTDWRPPRPPAQYTDGTVDPGFWGPDGVPDTEDDYYTDMELARGWASLIDTSTVPPSYFVENGVRREGFTRYPDPRTPGDITIEDMPRGIGPGEGYFLLRVTYDPPQPGEEFSDTDWHIRIESIGRVEGTQVFRRMVAYRALPMFNYARLVHNTTDHGQPAFLGIPPYLDMNNDGFIPPGDADGPSSEFLATTIDGPVKVNGQLRVAGAAHRHPDTGEPLEASTTFNLWDGVSPGGYYRKDRVEATAGIVPMDDHPESFPGQVRINDSAAADWLTYTGIDDEFDTHGGRVRDGVTGTGADGHSRFVSETRLPTLTLGDAPTNFDRYRNLTRGTGDLVDINPDPDSTEFVRSGRWGFGAGIYINNYNDIQFDHNIDALIADWQRAGAAAGAPTDTDSGWNALYTTYSPPGVKVEFFPEEPADLVPVRHPEEVDEPGKVWWPDYDPDEPEDQPGIRITRYDGRHWRTETGEDSGLNVRMFDYPTPWLDGTDDRERYPLIVAEGNVRVSGQLPPALVNGGDALRTYDMVIVSGGTIYIDGQLLAPNDYLPEEHQVDDEFNTRVVLLARDNVCLNTTQIVPQLTTGTAPAVPDDPLNPARGRHWELAPGSDGRLYSTFFWGDEPQGTHVALAVRQTAGDPGPSGVSLMTWVAGEGYVAYDFADQDPDVKTTPNPMRDTTFMLVPPGTTFPDGSVPPRGWAVEAIAPSWAPYRQRSQPETPEESEWAVPWDLAGYLDPTIGLRNAVVLRHADPRMPGGSTSYWAKRWKIAEYVEANGNLLPVGAINARVNAAVYAERGCWFVLTPGFFDGNVIGDEAVEFRRYNYRITFNGTIAENFTAPVEAVQRWTDELAYPGDYAGDTIASLARWGTIEYTFDETLRLARYDLRTATDTQPATMLPRLPLLPVSPDLVYYGD